MYKKILVCLDLSVRDQALLTYAAWLQKQFLPESITLFHASHVSYLPKQLRDKYMTEAHLKKLKTRVRSELAQMLESESELHADIEVVDGHPIGEAIDWIEAYKSDLVLVGKGSGSHSSVVFPEKLARRTDASILMVPQASRPVFKKILCATDFSDSANTASRVARSIAEASHAESLTLYHMYQPPVYQYDIELEFSDQFEWDYEKFDTDLHEHAKERMDTALTSLNFGNKGIGLYSHVEGGTDPVVGIIDKIAIGRHDLCVVGYRGQSRFEAFFLGSQTEKLIRSIRVPLLVEQSKKYVRSKILL